MLRLAAQLAGDRAPAIGIRLAEGRLLPRWGMRALAAALAVAVAWCGWMFWLRDAQLFAVQRVQITGLSGTVAPAIRDSLDAAARTMTTTHVDLNRLRAAVAPFTVVRDIRVSTNFPHGLKIQVIEQLPVMALLVGSQRLAVAEDGTIVQGEAASTSLPTVVVDRAPIGRRVSGATALEALALLDAAPRSLRDHVARVASVNGGLTAFMRAGPAVLFGNLWRLHAKWEAAARVLADPGSSGATYIDVRMPERTVAQVGDPQTLPANATGGAAATTAGTTTATGPPTTTVTMTAPAAPTTSTTLITATSPNAPAAPTPAAPTTAGGTAGAVTGAATAPPAGG